VKFSAGAVLATTTRVLPRTLLRLLPVVLVLHAPVVYLLYRVQSTDEMSPENMLAIAATMRWSKLLLLVDVPISAIVAHSVVSHLRGTRASVLASITSGLRRTPHAFAVMVLVYAAVYALAFAFTWFSDRAAGVDPSGTLGWLAVAAALAALLALYCRWFLVIPVVVLERTGILGAFGRSAQLTRGRRLQLAGIIIAVGVAFAGIYLSIIAKTSTGWDSDNPWYWYTSSLFRPWMVTGTTILYIGTNVLRAIVCASVFHLLYADAETGGPKTLRAIFD
jgi:hypothetical protein